jgi:hypothetical protein
VQTVTELIAAAEAAGTATPDDVTQAEQEAAQATQAAATLERRLLDGDDSVTAEEIGKARELSGFAKLRAEAVRRKAERTTRAARLRQCTDLAAEIQAYADTAGPRFAKLLRKVEQAIDTFTAAVDERNQLVAAWHRRAQDLGVAGHNTPLPVPPAEHGHVGIVGGAAMSGVTAGAALAAGRRRVPLKVDAPLALDTLVSAMRRRGAERDLHVGKLYARLETVDQVAGDPDPGLRFFRHRDNGGVVVVGDQQLAAPARDGSRNQWQRQIAAGELVEVSRKEAWGA